MPLLFVFFFSSLFAHEFEIKSVTTSIDWNQPIMDDLGFTVSEVSQRGQPYRNGYQSFVGTPQRLTSFYAPGGNFEGLDSGSFSFDHGWTLTYKGQSFDFRSFQLVLGSGRDQFHLLDRSGKVMFHVRNPHAYLHADYQQLLMINMDLYISENLALDMGLPQLKNFFLASVDLVMEITPPDEYRGNLSCTANFEGDVDVALTVMSDISSFAREENGRVAIACSAHLVNVGEADVAWYRSIFPDSSIPSLIGQHPYLVLHYYQMKDGVMLQVGQADVKHAFFAVNSGCSCAGGQVLYADCGDVYGASTNVNRTFLAPRDEVSAFSGAWSSLGSHFDGKVADDIRSHNESDHDRFEHRLNVQEADLQAENARFFIEGWYVVQGDVNIFNSMGFLENQPTFSGSVWSFPAVASYQQGSVLDMWVDPNEDNALTQSTLIDTGEGRLKLAVTVTDNGDSFHYEYALMNFDFDRQINQITIPLVGASPSTITNISSGRPDRDDDNWNLSLDNDQIQWSTTAGLDWGTLFNFSFDSPLAPVELPLTLGIKESGLTTSTEGLSLLPSLCYPLNEIQAEYPNWPSTNILHFVTQFNSRCPE